MLQCVDNFGGLPPHVCCSVLWCVAVCCGVLRCDVVCCSVSIISEFSLHMCAAVCGGVLRCVAV